MLKFACALLTVLIMSVPALAEPVAPLPELKPEGLKLLEQQGKTIEDMKKKVPSKEKVGAPIYPNALYSSSVKSNSDDMLSAVNLMSVDPPDKVREWYLKHADGWRYLEKFMCFVPKDASVKDIGDLMKTPAISIMDKDGPGITDMFWKVPKDVKTAIQITYDVK